MTNLTPSMRLKVNRDTFFIPDTNRGVYFRNNSSSFRMEGSTIMQWMEQLLPMFNGEHTMEELTNGLPGPYKNRVLEIAEVLLKNGFVRDISQDHPHQLKEHILKEYASQIEFLNHFGGSGAYRFQSYRQKQVLVIGSGSMLLSLVAALLESGLPTFHILITDSEQTNRQRLKELVARARKKDLEVVVEEVSVVSKEENAWQEAVRSFESVFYVSQEGKIEELRLLAKICKQENKTFLPAIFIRETGITGPLVKGDSDICWESVWHRIHKSALDHNRKFSSSLSTAGALLVNVIVFEWFKEMTGVNDETQNNQFYLLNSETLEGSWHAFFPHPLITDCVSVKSVQEVAMPITQKASRGDLSRCYMYFRKLTSQQAGIFHSWEEGDLKQLPLAQCRVQVVNPISEGPADLLPDIICADLTHEEARREAGIVGIESYVNELVKNLPALKEQAMMEVGAGESFVECICRGLQKCLDNEFRKRTEHSVGLIHLESVEDERCQYYLQSLNIMQGMPEIGLGEAINGFPVIWVCTSGNWFGCVGLNVTIALRKALQQAVITVQNKGVFTSAVPAIFREEKVSQNISIPVCDLTSQDELLQDAMKTLQKSNKCLMAVELELDVFLKNEVIEVVGVLVREGESR